MSPEAIVIRETPAGDGATRRIVYEPTALGHFERRTQLWRQSIDGWHTTSSAVVAGVTVERGER